MQVIFMKRKSLHKAIRSQHLKNYMNKIRYDVLQSQQSQSLNQLIEETSLEISQDQLIKICKLAANEETNAIIHMGNLILDQVISFELFQLVKELIIPKTNQHWPWLIRILASLGWASEYLFEYCMKSISVKKSDFALEQSLQTLKLILERHPTQVIPIILAKESLLLSLKSHTLAEKSKISLLSYEIIDTLIQGGDHETLQLANTCSTCELERILIIGLNKKSMKHLILIVRIINNLLATGIKLSRNIYIPCRQACFRAVGLLQVEFSYLWLSLVQNSDRQLIMQALQEDFLLLMEHLSKQEFQKQKHKIAVHQNIKAILLQLLSRNDILSKLQQQQIYSRIMICSQLKNLFFKRNVDDDVVDIDVDKDINVDVVDVVDEEKNNHLLFLKDFNSQHKQQHHHHYQQQHKLTTTTQNYQLIVLQQQQEVKEDLLKKCYNNNNKNNHHGQPQKYYQQIVQQQQYVVQEKQLYKIQNNIKKQNQYNKNNNNQNNKHLIPIQQEEEE